MNNKDARVVIVGAGAAGLSAAHHLIENGFDNVVILEATDRIGGRIHTVQFGDDDSIIELGANWIHGIGPENAIYTLAQSNGIIMKPYVFLDRLEGVWRTEDGHIIDKGLVQKAWHIFCQIETEIDDFYQYQRKSLKSCQEFIDDRIKLALNEFEVKHRHLVLSAFNCMVNYLCFHIGDDLKNISLELTGIFKEIPGGNVKIPKGFSKVTNCLSNEMPKNTIKFGKVVSAIYWEQPLSKVKVICEDEEYVADHTIVTCSLGYLKLHHNKLFKPPLPQNKMDAIENMGFGKVNKIFLYFEKPYWTKGKGGVKLAWNHTSNSFEESQWYTSIFAFDEVLNSPKVLVAWVHGKAAEYMETLPENTIIKTCAFLLQSFLKDDTIPAPTKVKRSTWCSYPYTAGSYSYFGVQSLSSDVKSLAEPLVLERRPIVCFAGEATSEQYFSTTHGARSSGIREAERLINYYNPHSML